MYGIKYQTKRLYVMAHCLSNLPQFAVSLLSGFLGLISMSLVFFPPYV